MEASSENIISRQLFIINVASFSHYETKALSCWKLMSFPFPQITIPIAQFVKNANQSEGIRIFYQIADFLLLIHFCMDPYIYVLLRTNYWIRFKSFARRLLCKTEDEFAELPKIDQDHHF